MKMTEAELMRHSASLFSKQSAVLPLWQTLAENFYPERADFTTTRNLGEELADNLIASYPVLARRDMANSLSSMLRDGDWFKTETDEVKPNYASKVWLDFATTRQKKFMEDRTSGFTRATKEGDHDYMTFGQCVIEARLNKNRNGLLYRCHHLRDCAWFEDETGQICGLHRKWKPTNYQLVRTYGADRVAPEINNKLRDQPHDTVDCIHIVMPAEMYGDDEISAKWKHVSIHMDVLHQKIMEVTGSNRFGYIVPRFQTIAGSPYAYSPATVCALPDARLFQAMTHTLLEAGERYVRPPLVAQAAVTRSDVDLTPDGITYVDREYDERLGEAIRPLTTQQGGFPIGFEMRADIRETIASAFYLNKISLPPVDGREMTAYEVQERMKQFRRENLPLFAPIEAEYNGQLCEETFNLMFDNSMFGSKFDVPEVLLGKQIVFKFKSPLSAADEEAKVQRFGQVRQILGSAIDLDPTVIENVDLDVAMRDALQATGAPTTWLVDENSVIKRKEARAQMREAIAAQQGMVQGGAPTEQAPPA